MTPSTLRHTLERARDFIGEQRVVCGDYFRARGLEVELHAVIATLPPEGAAEDRLPTWAHDDVKVLKFLSIAMRHVEVVGTLRAQDIRDGLQIMASRELTEKPNG